MDKLPLPAARAAGNTTGIIAVKLLRMEPESMISPYTRKAGMGRVSSPARSWAGASVCPNISVKIRMWPPSKAYASPGIFSIAQEPPERNGWQ